MIDAACRKKRAVFLKVEPDTWEVATDMTESQPPPGFQPSLHAIQPRRTLIVDLQGDEDELLARMKQKTRYNIRLATRKGVVIKQSDDISSFYQMMKITGVRGEFGVHTEAYYQWAYDLFKPRDECALLIAEFGGQPIAAFMVFSRGTRAWYLYGGSANVHRNLMPTYLLQWEAMRWAKQKGCEQYDLWGVPDEPEEILEANFQSRSDGLWGVYRNKRGFGGVLQRAVGPWDRVYNPAFYAIYQWWMKRSLS
jgi:lipid II:glycine glycyltransferase (peptidoglycan interpeptide bridge formation enzyme)